MTAEKKIVTVILNWNRFGDTAECVESVLSAVCPREHEVVVVDNNSTDGSKEGLTRFNGKCRIILLEDNLGYAGGNNVGIRYSIDRNADYTLILNNDVIVEKNALSEMMRAFSENPSAGIVGAVVYSYPPPGRIDFSGSRIVWFTADHIEKKSRIDCNAATDMVHGCAMMVRNDVFKKIGLFDDKYFLFFEDMDFCVRAKRNGFNIYMAKGSKVWHKGSLSTYGTREETNPKFFYYVTRNRLLFLKKNFPYGRNLFLVSVSLSILLNFVLMAKVVLGRWIFGRKNVSALVSGVINGIIDFFKDKYGKEQ